MAPGMITPKRHRKSKVATPKRRQIKNGDNDQLITPITGSSNKIVILNNKDNNFEIPNYEKSCNKSITERLLDCSNTNSIEQESASVSSNGLHSPGDEFDANIFLSEAKTPIREEFDSGTISEPKTPENKLTYPTIQDKLHFDSDSDSDVEIRKINHLKNPFSLSGSPKLLNPFVSTKQNNKVDYDNALELVNHKTGKKFVHQLTDEQKKIKPKRLHFDHTSNDISSEANFLANNDTINHFDRLVNIRSKKTLNFEIFNDPVNDPK